MAAAKRSPGTISSSNNWNRYFIIPWEYTTLDRSTEPIRFKLALSHQNDSPGSVTQFIPRWMELVWL